MTEETDKEVATTMREQLEQIKIANARAATQPDSTKIYALNAAVSACVGLDAKTIGDIIDIAESFYDWLASNKVKH